MRSTNESSQRRSDDSQRWSMADDYLADPAVAACAVLGVPDRRLGERVVAAIELAPGASLDAEALREHCAESLARYKIPKSVVFTDTLPRTAAGKVLKKDLKQTFGGEA